MICKPYRIILLLFLILSSFFCSTPETTYTVEVIDGIRYVQNFAPSWGDEPKVAIELVRTIGDLDTPDENFQLFLPIDVAEDSKGNIYVLDSGNFRIQKYNPEGKFLSTIGRRGNGPVEFELAIILEMGVNDEMYVVDSGNRRIEVLTTDGREVRTINWNIRTHSFRLNKSGEFLVSKEQGVGRFTPEIEDYVEPLISVYDLEGIPLRGIGKQKVFDTPTAHITGNTFHITTDKDYNIYATFLLDNRIEKFSPDGKLIFRTERSLNFEVTDTVYRDTGGGSYDVDWAKLVSKSIGVDYKGRIWVATYDRQTREDERVGTAINFDRDGVATVHVFGDTDIVETDVFKLEIFDSEGILLGEIPLKHFVDTMRIFEDRLYIVDRLRGMQVFQYTINN